LISALKTKKDGGAFAANRTVQTLCVEGISEYCRIMYDVFPEDALVHVPPPSCLSPLDRYAGTDPRPPFACGPAQVSVMTAGEETQRFNSWAAEQQCMKQVSTSSPHTTHTTRHTTRTTRHARHDTHDHTRTTWTRSEIAEVVCVQIMDGFAGSSTSEATLGWISEALDQAVAALTEVRRRC
jgi:hypothetical protein